MAFRMSGPTQMGRTPYRYVGNRMAPKPNPAPYTPPVAAPVAAPGPGTGGGLGSGHFTGGGGGVDNSDLDGNYDAMMARIQAGHAGAGYSRGQPISPDNPGNHAPGAVAGYDGQPTNRGGGQAYDPYLRGPNGAPLQGNFHGMDPSAGYVPNTNTNLGLNGHANGTYGGYARGGVVEPDGYQFDNPIRQVSKGEVQYGRKKRSLHTGGYFADGGAVGDTDSGGDDLSEALAVVKDVENHRRRQHGLLDGEPESENVEDRRGNDLLRPAERLGSAKQLDGAFGVANRDRMLAGSSPVRGDLEDNGVRAKGPLFADGGAVDDPEGDYQEPAPPHEGLEVQGPPDERPTLQRLYSDAAGEDGGPKLAQRFMAYLQGADASHPDVAKQYEAQVDPEGSRDEGERKVLAVAAAAQDAGPDAAAALSASYRQKYDAFRGMAAGALAHGDLDKAAEAATKAYPNVLDGADVKFARQGNGFTATVTKPGQKPESFPLSTNQFDEFVKGNAGQYDHVTDIGADVLLKDLSQSGGGAIPAPGAENIPMPGAAAAGASQAAPKLDQWIDDQGIQRAGNPMDHPEGKRTGTPVAARPDRPDNIGYSDQIKARALARFPMVSQSSQRMEYMQKLEDDAAKQATEHLKATEPSAARKYQADENTKWRNYQSDQRLEGEKTKLQGVMARAQAYERVNDVKSGVKSEGQRLQAMNAMNKIIAEQQNVQMKNGAMLAGKELLNVPLGKPLSKQTQDFITQIQAFKPSPLQAVQQMGQSTPAPQAPAPGAAAPQAPQPGAVQRRQDPTGKWWSKQNGLWQPE